jgi:site-specific recombinase XerD
MKVREERFFILLRQFLTVYLSKHKCYSPNTIQSYKAAFNLFFDYLRDEKGISLEKAGFAQFSHGMISEFLDWIEHSRNCGISTRNQRLFALKSFMKFALQEDPLLMATQIELDKIPIKKTPSKTISFLTAAALKSLLQQPNPDQPLGIRNRFLMNFMNESGARIQEVLDTKVNDIVLDAECPYVYLTGKGSKTRVVPLMQKTVDHLRQYLSLFHAGTKSCGKDYLFYTVIHGNKCKMSPDNVAHFLKRYALEARTVCPEIPEQIHPHMLRHTRAMHLYRGGMPLPLIQEFLGHAEMRTTLIYAYADTEMKRAAIRKADPQVSPEVMELPSQMNDEQSLRKLYGLR